MKTLVIDAIIGVGFPSVVLASECERIGMAEYTGTATGPSWAWRRERLEKCEEHQLQELYTALREAREENELAAYEVSKNNMPSIEIVSA